MQQYKNSYKFNPHALLSLWVYNTGFQRCTPLYRWGPGVRDHYLMHHVLAGKGTYTARGKTYALCAGDTFLAYPGDTITYCADEAEPWEYGWVGFHGSDARWLMEQTPFTPERLAVHTGDDAQLRALLEGVYAARGARAQDAVRMTGALYAFLAFFMAGADERRMRDQSALYARQACAYMAGNYARRMSIVEMADNIGVSRSCLYRAFVQTMGVSPMQYLCALRIRQACQLLQGTALPVKAVAFSVGFEDALYFSRAFKREMGVSPRAYALEVGKGRETGHDGKTL